MKHSKRIAGINKEKKPLGFRKIVVEDNVYWWKIMNYSSGITILDSNRKLFYSDYWGGEGPVRPSDVAEWIKKKLTSTSLEK